LDMGDGTVLDSCCGSPVFPFDAVFRQDAVINTDWSSDEEDAERYCVCN
jgi:hypothetical protein